MTTMEASYGTEQQAALLRKIDGSVGWLITTPGACHGGCCFATDDPDLLGWDVILRRLREDGVFGFRLLAPGALAAVGERLAGQGYALDIRDVYAANANTVREALRALDLSAPAGYRLIDAETLTYPDTIRETQALLAANGVAPVSAAMLSGRHGPCALAAISGPNGAIAAAAFSHFPHNVHSRHDDNALVGPMVVDPGHRGKGLGAIVSALAMRTMIERRGARTIHELAVPGDEAARQTAERCGLALDETAKSALAVPQGADPFTR
ncbi:MAG: hypothetical protein Kow0026_16420 [Oricola sp.]